MNKEQAEKLLAALGNSHTEVAHALRTRGITGCSRRAASCPIANYLVSQGADSDLNVGQTRVYFDLADAIGLSLPSPVKVFILEFDRGMFPDLEEKRLVNAPTVNNLEVGGAGPHHSHRMTTLDQ